jgi:hypothetical protein
MKLLPQKFTKKGYKHLLVKREDNVAIYKRSSVENSKIVHYEVIIITSHNGTTIEGNYIEPGELYPSTSQWGEKGWTCLNLEKAEERFKEVKKKIKVLEAKAVKKKLSKNK